MICKFSCNFLYLLLCSGILSLEAQLDISIQQQQLVIIRNTTTTTNCDPTPIIITSFTQQTTFVILEVISYGGENITICTSPSTTCYIGTSTGMVLYPSTSKGETHLTAYLSVVLPHITETVGLNAYKYGPNDPLPGGGGYGEITDAVLHHSQVNGLDVFSFHRAAAGTDCMPDGGGECDPAGNASSLLLYDVFLKDADDFHSNYTYTQACERIATSSPHDDVTITCVKRAALGGESLKRFVWNGDDDMSEFSIFGIGGCRNVVVVVQVTDPAFNSTSAYLPFHLNTGSLVTTHLEYVILMVVNCFVLLLGFLICFFGNRLLPFSFVVHCWFVFTFVFSTAFSPLMAYELIGYGKLLEISTGVSALLDIILFIFWWRYNLTKMAVLIISISGGFVTSCILLATKLSSLPIMQLQLNVILFFSSISILFISFNLLMTSQQLVMMISSLLGSSLMIYASSLWLCSSVISLIIPHALRRLVTWSLEHYVDVTNSFLGLTDEVLIGVWCSLFVLGLFSQFCQHRSKASLPLTPMQPENITPPRVDDASSDDCSAGTYSYDGDVSDDTDHSENDDVTVPFRIVDERTNLLPPRTQTIT